MGSLVTVDFFTAEFWNAILQPNFGAREVLVSKGLVKRMIPGL